MAGWSPFQKSVYGGSFRGPGAGLQVFAVLEKHLLREKILDLLYCSCEMRKLRKAVNEAINEGHVDGQWIEQIQRKVLSAKRRQRKVMLMLELTGPMSRTTRPLMEDRAFLFAHAGKSTTLGLMDSSTPNRGEHRASVCTDCWNILNSDDAYSKPGSVSEKCIRCVGIEQLEKTSVHAYDNEPWSQGMHLSLRTDYEDAFRVIVSHFDLLLPKESELVAAYLYIPT